MPLFRKKKRAMSLLSEAIAESKYRKEEEYRKIEDFRARCDAARRRVMVKCMLIAFGVGAVLGLILLIVSLVGSAGR